MAPFLMPDISHYQPTLSEQTAKLVKTSFGAIMFKATEGTSFTDPNLADNIRAAQAVGLQWGVYHFVRQGQGASQAASCVAESNRIAAPTFYVIDWEDGDRNTVLDIKLAIKKLTSSPVGIYSGAWSRSHGGPPIGFDFAMVPEYGPAQLDPAYYPNPYPLTAWQYTDGKYNGTQMPSSVPGIGPCDISVVYHPEKMGLGEDMSAYDDFKAGVRAAKNGEKLPAKASDDFVFGYNMEVRANSNPKPGAAAPHTHNFSGTTGANS